MLKQILAGTAAVAAMALVMPAMAFDNPNPWEGDGAEVGVNINVGTLGEVYSNLGTGQARDGTPPPTLEITNAGGCVASQGIAVDTINHAANLDYEVSVELDGDIPLPSRLHVLVGIQNPGAYNNVGAWTDGHAACGGAVTAQADNIITWQRGDFANPINDTYVGPNQPGDGILALQNGASLQLNPTSVEYVVDSIQGIPAQQQASVQLLWTIAPQ